MRQEKAQLLKVVSLRKDSVEQDSGMLLPIYCTSVVNGSLPLQMGRYGSESSFLTTSICCLKQKARISCENKRGCLEA